MADIIDPTVAKYAEAHTSAPPPYLAEVGDWTRSEMGPKSRMLTGALEGRFLEMLVFALGARQVLEIGTFSGYSAIAMAGCLAAGGTVTTCEIDPEHAAAARVHIAGSPYGDRIEVVEGPALDTVRSLPGPFDLVFIDADKTGYAAYYEAVLGKLAPGGLIAVDNTLWSGSVAGDEDQSDDTRALRAFNDMVVADPRVVCVQLTVRDGVTLIRRADDSGLARRD